MPIIALAVVLGYNCALLIGFGGIVNTACLKLNDINRGISKYDISQLNSTIYSLGSTWFLKRTEVEAMVSDPERLSKFITYFEECGIGEEDNFQAKKL